MGRKGLYSSGNGGPSYEQVGFSDWLQFRVQSLGLRVGSPARKNFRSSGPIPKP